MTDDQDHCIDPARAELGHRAVGGQLAQRGEIARSENQILDVAEGDRWILEPGVYWASEGSVDLGLHKERFWPSLWAGDGLFPWRTSLAGDGRVAINAPGPVETIEVRDSEVRVQGRLVLGRTDGLTFHSQRSSTFLRHFISGQQRLRVFSGTGKALVCWTPYWNEHLYKRMTGESIKGSLFE